MKNEINENIVALRNEMKRRNLTQEQVAEISGVPLSTVRKILAGFTQNPGIETMNLLYAAIYGVQKEMPAGFPSDISQFENDLRKVNFPVDKWTQLSDEQQRILLSTIENFIKNNK